MQLAKALEFRAVAAMACDDEVIPLQERIEAIGDEADLEEAYPASATCSTSRVRVRETILFVSGVEPASEFLNDLVA